MGGAVGRGKRSTRTHSLSPTTIFFIKSLLLYTLKTGLLLHAPSTKEENFVLKIF